MPFVEEKIGGAEPFSLREQRLVSFLGHMVELFGKFTIIEANYETGAYNPYSRRRCEFCLFREPTGGCAVVDVDTEPDGGCRLNAIAGLVNLEERTGKEMPKGKK